MAIINGVKTVLSNAHDGVANRNVPKEEKRQPIPGTVLKRDSYGRVNLAANGFGPGRFDAVK